MQRLYNGLCQHFQQEPGLPIRLYVEGHGDILTIISNGDITVRGVQTYPKELKCWFLDKPESSTEELIQWLEVHTSLLLRIKKNGTVYNQ